MPARTMKRIVIVALLLIAIAAAACVALFAFGSGTAFDEVRTSALNTVIDNTGIKDRIQSELEARTGSIAEQYGIPQSILDKGVDMLEIDKWKVTSLPEDAKVEKTLEMDLEGSPVQVTLYDDDSIVSFKGEGKFNTLGQTITFEVPESAQQIANMLPYLDAAGDSGILDALSSMGNAG